MKRSKRDKHKALMRKKARHEKTKKGKDPNTQSPSMVAYKAKKIDLDPKTEAALRGGILPPVAMGLMAGMFGRMKPKKETK